MDPDAPYRRQLESEIGRGWRTVAEFRSRVGFSPAEVVDMYLSPLCTESVVFTRPEFLVWTLAALRRDPPKQEYGTGLGAYGCLSGGQTAKAAAFKRGRPAIANWNLVDPHTRFNPWNSVPRCPAIFRMVSDTAPIYLTGRALGDPHVHATAFQPKYADTVAKILLGADWLGNTDFWSRCQPGALDESAMWRLRPPWFIAGLGPLSELVPFDGGLTAHNPPQAFTPPNILQLQQYAFLQPAFDWIRHYRARIEHKIWRLKQWEPFCTYRHDIDQIDEWTAAIIQLEQWKVSRCLPYGPHWGPCPAAWWPLM